MSKKATSKNQKRFFTKKQVILILGMLILLVSPLLYLFFLFTRNEISSQLEDRRLARAADEYLISVKGWQPRVVSFGGEHACFKGVCRYVEYQYRKPIPIDQSAKKETLSHYTYLKQQFDIVEENTECGDEGIKPRCHMLLKNNDYQINVNVHTTETDSFLYLNLEEVRK